MTLSAAALYADLYDASGVGWPGELDFYRALAATAAARPQASMTSGHRRGLQCHGNDETDDQDPAR